MLNVPLIAEKSKNLSELNLQYNFYLYIYNM